MSNNTLAISNNTLINNTLAIIHYSNHQTRVTTRRRSVTDIVVSSCRQFAGMFEQTRNVCWRICGWRSNTDHRKSNGYFVWYSTRNSEKHWKVVSKEKHVSNPTKSEMVLFSRRYRPKLYRLKPSISYNLELIIIKQVNYLGVVLDSRLNWKAHGDAKCQKAFLRFFHFRQRVEVNRSGRFVRSCQSRTACRDCRRGAFCPDTACLPR